MLRCRHPAAWTEEHGGGLQQRVAQAREGGDASPASAVARACPLLVLHGEQRLRNECAAKLHPHLLSTGFLRLIYGRYECTNPFDFFWTVSPLITHGPPPDLLTPCGSAAFSELFSWEGSPRLGAGKCSFP